MSDKFFSLSVLQSPSPAGGGLGGLYASVPLPSPSPIGRGEMHVNDKLKFVGHPTFVFRFLIFGMTK